MASTLTQPCFIKQVLKWLLHSDSPEDIRFLNIEVAKARSLGKLLGIEISDDELIQWITANPAWALGIEDSVGSLEAGKWADLVVWDAYPFSAYSKAKPSGCVASIRSS